MIKSRLLTSVLATAVLFSATSLTYAATLNVPASFSSIQDAVNSARNGDTVRVTGGIYNEFIVVSTRIRIIGRSSPTLNGAIDVQANRVTVRGFNILADVTDGGFGIRLAGDRGIASRNNIDTFQDDEGDGFGILVTGDSNSVERNVIEGGGSGIQVNQGADYNAIENNRVQFSDNSGFDIEGNSTLIEDNEADFAGGADGPGFDISGTGHKIIDNFSSNNNGSGFSIVGSGHAIRGNVADGNDENGFSIRANDSMISDHNLATDNAVGFDVSGRNNFFDNNEADDNEQSGWRIGGSENSFINNEANNNDIGIEVELSGGVAPTGNDFRFNECNGNRISSTPSGLCNTTN